MSGPNSHLKVTPYVTLKRKSTHLESPFRCQQCTDCITVLFVLYSHVKEYQPFAFTAVLTQVIPITLYLAYYYYYLAWD